MAPESGSRRADTILTRKRRSRTRQLVIGLFVTVLLVALGSAVGWQLRPLPQEPKTVRLLFRRNWNAQQIGVLLVQNRVISNARLFALLARVSGRSRNLQPGRYTLPMGISEFRALQLIERGGERLVRVTIPEGFTLRQIARRMAAEDVCDSLAFITAARDTQLLRRLGIVRTSAEGYLFPDTYLLPVESPADEIVGLMYRRFRGVLAALTDTGTLTPQRRHEVVTLASLIEAEAEQDSERPLIASVFLNRLKRRMPLQSCATVQYLLPQRKAVLTAADTRIESPYNTYLHPGLPPGPINNPGRSSLQAALQPAETDYLYFVAKGDGRHHFSATFAAHLAAQRRYRSSRQK